MDGGLNTCNMNTCPWLTCVAPPATAFTIDSTADFDAGVRSNTATITQNPGTAVADSLELKNGEIVPDGNTKALWHMNEGSTGTTADSSGNGNIGTINGASWTPSGKFGNSLSFDGISNYVRAVDSPSLNMGTGPFTVIAWFKATYKPSSIIYKGCNWNNNAGWALSYASSPQLLYLLVGNGASHIEYNTGLGTVASWKQIGLIRKPDNTIYYINDGTVTNTGYTVTGSVSNGVPLDIGTGYSYLNGVVDEVALYDRALDVSEIAALYNGGVQYKSSGNWMSAPQAMPPGQQLYDLTIAVSGGDGSNYITQTEILDASDDSVITTSSTHISTTTTLTAADFPGGFSGTLNKNLKVKVYMVGSGSSTILVDSIVGRAV